MKIKKVNAVFFSPTGNTAQVCKVVAGKLAAACSAELAVRDFTLPKSREASYSYGEDELVIVAMPTYAGRLPNKIVAYVQSAFKGNRTPMIAVTTFGNRSFDSSLTELVYEFKKNGFVPFAAASVGSRHAFDDNIGRGRPDGEDIKELVEFASKTADLLNGAEILNPVQVSDDELPAPYYVPLGEDGAPVKFLKATPKTDEDKCTFCGLCAVRCPMGSIDFIDTSAITGVCIKCQACVRYCPVGAKYFDDPAFISHVNMLKKNCTDRVPSAFYI